MLYSRGRLENEDDNFLDEGWDNVDDYNLFDGIARYGMEEWDRIIRDSDLWDHGDTKTYNDKDVWKLIFKRIEEKEPPADQEKECLQ